MDYFGVGAIITMLGFASLIGGFLIHVGLVIMPITYAEGLIALIMGIALLALVFILIVGEIIITYIEFKRRNLL